MEKCKTCKWREDGSCQHDKIREFDGTEELDDELIYAYDESGYFMVGPEFGCVHHEARE